MQTEGRNADGVIVQQGHYTQVRHTKPVWSLFIPVMNVWKFEIMNGLTKKKHRAINLIKHVQNLCQDIVRMKKAYLKIH